MAKSSGTAGRQGGERLEVRAVQGPGGVIVYQVGGEKGRIFSTNRAAVTFANRRRIKVGELDTMPVMRKGREVSRRRMTLKELSSNSDFKNLKVGDRVEVYGIRYTVWGTNLYGNKDIISIRSEYNDITSEIRERFVIRGGRKL